MPREINSATIAHLQQKQTSVIQMIALDFTPDPVYVHSDVGTIEWDNKEWLGVGALGAFTEVTEDDSLDANETTVGLSIITRGFEDLVNEARTSNYIGRQAIIYGAARDLITGELIGAPIIVIDGEMQSLNFDVGIDAASAALTIIDGRSSDNRSYAQNYSDAHQQRRHAGDRFLSFMANTASFNEHWGPGGPSANASFTNQQAARAASRYR